MNACGRMAVMALLAVVMGCENKSDTPAGGSLQGTPWKLTGWSLSSLNPADFTITATFANGQISGTSGVNSYSGSCQIGPGNAFDVGTLASTMMAGPEPAMRAEAAYLSMLEQARSYAVSGGTLTLSGKGGAELLIFAR